jgi:serine/threonine protein kinase
LLEAKQAKKGGFVMMNLAGQEVGDYTLLRLLGQGNSAYVYLGKHKHHQSYVAVKIQATHYWQTRGRNEVYMLSYITHPHVIRMREHGTQDHMRFFVMDFATQGTLLDLLAQNIPISRVAIYVSQIAAALQHMHMRHIIHRDIKPANILVESSEKFLLADFELATDHRTCQSTIATPAYAAPEQTQGRPCPASDQYALAVIVYQWLCGELPFQGTWAETAAQHRYVSPPPLREKAPTLPHAVEQVVLTALAKDPNARFPNIQAFAAFFQQACQSSAYWTPPQVLSSNTDETLGEDPIPPSR